MTSLGNDKNKFRSSFLDTISLFCRLSLKYSKNLKIDGCIAVTVDDSEVVVVNISKLIKGTNSLAVYPSLRISGKDGRSYILLKEDCKTPTCNNSPNVFVGSPSVNPTKSPSTSKAHIVQTTNSVHLTVSQKEANLNKSPKNQEALIPNKQNFMRSLINGQILVHSVPNTSSSTPVTEVNPSESSEMSRRVLQARSGQQQLSSPISIKQEPQEDSAYGQSKESVMDKENVKNQEPSGQKRKRSSSVPATTNDETGKRKSQSPVRKSSRLKQERVESDELQDEAITSSIHQSVVESFSSSDDDEEEYSSDDWESTASSTEDDEHEILFTCSEKFTQDCSTITKKIDDLLNSMKSDVDKNNSKDLKRTLTRNMNTYGKIMKDFEIAKSKGFSNIKAVESKIEKDLKHLHESLTRGDKEPVNYRKKKEVKSDCKSSKMARVSRMCGECGPCQKQEDCRKCIFCKDKTKFGGPNTLRQKCIKRQCLNKGRFKTVKGKVQLQA